jgi:hypothetical protein
MLVLPLSAGAETLRIATWNVALFRAGPGLLLRDILRDDDAQVGAVVDGIAQLNADVLLLTAIDFDMGQAALAALSARLARAGVKYPYHMALRPNTGVATGLDLDGNGRRGQAGDAQGWGRFAGFAGMAILSRLPIRDDLARDFSDFLWRDLPGAVLPGDLTPEAAAIQRLSTSGHWEVPVVLPDGALLRLLVWYATPPVFDGPEDRNGRRNHDETAFWLRLLDGDLAYTPPAPPFVVLGDANLDPVDGDGRADAILSLLAHPRLQDIAPRGQNRRSDRDDAGDASLDTADFSQSTAAEVGRLRVDYLLPSADLQVTGAGVLWPDDDRALARASRHRPVWADVRLDRPQAFASEPVAAKTGFPDGGVSQP